MAKQTHAGQAAIMKRVLHYIKRSWPILFYPLYLLPLPLF